MQAYGTAESLNGETREFLTVTKNPGRYLQLAIPLNIVDDLAYAALPFGIADPVSEHALNQMDKREDLSEGGQTRLIARPDLMWRFDVMQKVYQFSRGAEKKRLEYLRNMENLLRNKLGTTGLVRIARKLRPPPIVVLSYNVKYNNQTPTKVIARLTSAATYDFACLQETTDHMLDVIKKNLPSSHKVLYEHACGAKNVYAAMAYRSERFDLVGNNPFYGCFKLKSGKEQGGRPAVGAIFHDKWVGRRILVLSIHAPHDDKEPYLLMPNLQYFVKKTIEAANVQWTGNLGVAHVVIGGDFNRDDWQKQRKLQAPYGLKLRSAQGLTESVLPTIHNKAFDNILFGSRQFRYALELHTFYKETDKRGSDHNPVVAQFLC
jgi:endonuclease/exonuclease/phosphatase family metal-dependent hydrolase